MSIIRYIRGADLHNFPVLQDSMFKDRAKQFVSRLNWSALNVDERGWERDEYDHLDPLYVIWEQADGTHGASMRLLPTNGPSMLHDHFGHVLPLHGYRSKEIWECSRFVVSPKANRLAAPALFVGAGELFRRNRARAFLGLFDRRMLRVYKMMKNYPEILGIAEGQEDWVAAGLWKMSIPVWERSLASLQISPETSSFWFDDSNQRSLTTFTEVNRRAA